jgi:hypothetical protein
MHAAASDKKMMISATDGGDRESALRLIGLRPIAIQAGLALGMGLYAVPLVMQARADDVPPAWAYAVNPSDFKPEPDDGMAPRTLTGRDANVSIRS